MVWRWRGVLEGRSLCAAVQWLISSCFATQAAAGESFLCACLLSDGKVAVGSNRGRIHVVDPWEAEPPVCVVLERAQEVVAVCDNVENTVAETSAGWCSRGFSQRQLTPQAAPSVGPASANGPLGTRWPAIWAVFPA